MKKLLLSIAFLATSLSAFSQTLTFTRDWTLLYGTSPLITRPAVAPTSLNGNQSLAYNPTTNRIYLVDRESKISILNADGSVYAAKPELTIGTMPLPSTSPWSDGYRFNKVRVAADGAIYAITLKLGAGDLFVYRWISETDVNPTRTAVNVPARSGDSFAVYGSGNNTRLYFGGASNSVMTVASVTAGLVTKMFDVNLTGGFARTTISPISNTEFIIKTSGDITRLLTIPGEGNMATNAIVAGTVSTIPTGTGASQINNEFTGYEYFEREGKKYLAVFGAVVGSTNPVPAGNKALSFELFNVTAGLTNAGIVKLGGSRMIDLPALPDVNTNPNGFNDLGIKNNANGTMTFFQVLHGTGVASYTTVEVVLPVSLTSFSGFLVKGQSTLAWSTASEKNNKGFDVLRSTDGKNFSSVGFVPSKGQNGNAATALDYSFVDRTAAAGVNYYQLNQIDLDGKAELSKDVVSVNVSLSGDAITVYPNPVTSYVNVSTGGLDYKGFKYEIFDGNGKKVLSQKAKSGEQQISVANLAPSVYFLKVSKDNVPQKTVKLIKK